MMNKSEKKEKKVKIRVFWYKDGGEVRVSVSKSGYWVRPEKYLNQEKSIARMEKVIEKYVMRDKHIIEPCDCEFIHTGAVPDPEGVKMPKDKITEKVSVLWLNDGQVRVTCGGYLWEYMLAETTKSSMELKILLRFPFFENPILIHMGKYQPSD